MLCSACVTTMDVQQLLGLEAAQLTAANEAPGSRASYESTALSAAWTDPTVADKAYFVLSLHCRGELCQ